MQSASLALYLPAPFLKPRSRSHHSNPTLLPSSSSSLSRLLELGIIPRKVLCRKRSSFLHPEARHVSRLFLVATNEEEDKSGSDVKARATPVSGSADDSVKPSAAIRTLQLGAMFGIWCLLNIYFNIYNKQVPTLSTARAFENTILLSLILTRKFGNKSFACHICSEIIINSSCH